MNNRRFIFIKRFIVIFIITTITFFTIISIYHKGHDKPYDNNAYLYLEDVAKKIESGEITTMYLPPDVYAETINHTDGTQSLQLFYYDDYYHKEPSTTVLLEMIFFRPYCTDDEFIIATFDKGKIIKLHRTIENQEEKIAKQMQINLFFSIVYSFFFSLGITAFVFITKSEKEEN